jgi:hypothetical protein
LGERSDGVITGNQQLIRALMFDAEEIGKRVRANNPSLPPLSGGCLRRRSKLE